MNRNKTYYCDWRLQDVCAYCGDFADTEDHVPSRCFLDKPLPNNLPVVPCCEKCNKSFSEDEEYISCIIDCMKEGTTNIEFITREKTRKTMSHSIPLANRIKCQQKSFGEFTYWDYEKERFERVIRKLAFGHLAFFNEMIAFDYNCQIKIRLLDQMNENDRNAFELEYFSDLLPEVGSRALLNNLILVTDENNIRSVKSISQWQVVQDGRYRYCTSNDGNKVKFVIAEYLAIEVMIENK